MKPDPAFATSPIFVTDKDYEFSVDPDIITLAESDPFYGYESETIVAHLTKLNDIATLFTNDESDDENMPAILEGYIFDAESSAAIFACQDRYELKRLLVKWSKESLRDRMRPDPALLLHLSVFPIRIIMNFLLIQI